MGWASAGDIFDPVAQALVDLGADRDTKWRVLGTLIDKLQDGDWDTEDESWEEFRHDPDIVALFGQRGIRSKFEEPVLGDLDYHPGRDEWVLVCDVCGTLDAGDGRSVDERDRLVRLWAQHGADRHDGDGEVDTWMLSHQDGAP